MSSRVLQDVLTGSLEIESQMKDTCLLKYHAIKMISNEGNTACPKFSLQNNLNTPSPN